MAENIRGLPVGGRSNGVGKRIARSSLPYCHSERSEESLRGFRSRAEGEIPRLARNDKISYFFRNLKSFTPANVENFHPPDERSNPAVIAGL
jgi:hypothetical protein